MKFAIVAVVLALGLGAQSAVLHAPLAAPLIAPLAPLSAYTPYSAYPPFLRSPFRFDYAPGHHIVVSAPHAPYYAPQFTGEGTYVAKTLGSEHVAPLPGHSASAASINLEPAPGTE